MGFKELANVKILIKLLRCQTIFKVFIKPEGLTDSMLELILIVEDILKRLIDLRVLLSIGIDTSIYKYEYSQSHSYLEYLQLSMLE